jgi:hypothetical protein
MLGVMDQELATAKIDDLKGRDLSPSVIQRARAPKPTWFVKRLSTGFIFPCEEREAWDLLNNKSQWKSHDFQFIGFSDGKTFQAYVNKASKGAEALLPELTKKRAEIAKYRSLEEKLMLDEMVDMDGDPSDAENEANKKKVLRLRGILDKYEDQLEELEKQYRKLTSDVVKSAEAEELKVAQENWAVKKTWPRQMNILTPGASRQERNRILGAMGQTGLA